MEWISVKDKLPDVGQNVFVCSKNGHVQEVAYSIGKWDDLLFWVDCLEEFDSVSFDQFTHWMPLPQPPKSE